MLLDIKTLSFMLMLASVLYAITIVFFATLAHTYKGINLYMLGAIFSAMGFLVGAIFTSYPENNILRFIGTVTLNLACYFYSLGIIKFLEVNFNNKKLLYCLILSLILSFFLVFIKNEYIYLNGIITSVFGIVTYGTVCYFLWQKRTQNYASSIYLMIFSFIIILLILSTRPIFIITYHIDSVIEDNQINKLFFVMLFISGYVRNIGFIIMVCQRLYQDLRDAALYDFLTTLLNRRAVQEKLDLQFNQFQRYYQPCTIILLDIDYFKRINDNYGHEKGDAVLQQIAAILKTNLRKTDTIGRWGGEEFLIILPNTSINEALTVAEKLRYEIANTQLQDLNCTISLGIAKLEKTDNSIEQVIKRTDDALYSAKNKGRNCIEILI